MPRHVLQLAFAGLLLVALLSILQFSSFPSSPLVTERSGSAIRAKRRLALLKYGLAAREVDRQAHGERPSQAGPQPAVLLSLPAPSETASAAPTSGEAGTQLPSHGSLERPAPASLNLAPSPLPEAGTPARGGPSSLANQRLQELMAAADAAVAAAHTSASGGALPGSIEPLPFLKHHQQQEAAARWGTRDPSLQVAGAVDTLPPDASTAAEKAEAVKKGMLHAWHSYERYAMGAAELAPLTKRPRSNILGGAGIGGLGVTVVDALSTLHIMGLTQEADRARQWATTMEFDKSEKVSFFETTIRLLGGLVSAYDLTGDPAVLRKAEDLGGRLLAAFNHTATGLPVNDVLLNGTLRMPGKGPIMLAELGSNLLEFGALGVRSGRPEFLVKPEVAIRQLHKANPNQALLPTRIERSTGATLPSTVSVGAEADSYYEYLLKYWILMGKQDDLWRQRWEAAVDQALRELVPVFEGRPDLKFTSSRRGSQLETTLEHLTCFWPGNLALGVMHGAVRGPKAEQYLDFARRMTHACFQLYNITATGLGAEKVAFDVPAGEGRIMQPVYLQRPEVVESLFYLHRATGEEVYRQWGWQMFTAFERHCRQEAGYAGVQNVHQLPPTLTDAQQSWLLAETFKYWYLLFSPPSALSLDHWVLNTEAHPLRVVTLGQFEALNATLAQHRAQEEEALKHREVLDVGLVRGNGIFRGGVQKRGAAVVRRERMRRRDGGSSTAGAESRRTPGAMRLR